MRSAIARGGKMKDGEKLIPCQNYRSLAAHSGLLIRSLILSRQPVRSKVMDAINTISTIRSDLFSPIDSFISYSCLLQAQPFEYTFACKIFDD